MRILNLTPHKINVFNENGERVRVLLPYGIVARVSVKNKLVKTEDRIPYYTQEVGKVQGLMKPQDDVIYVVSTLVRTSLPERTDLASPGELIRDDDGQPIGCKGLVFNRKVIE